MNNLAKISIIIILTFSIFACSTSPQKSEIALTDETPMLVLDTGNSEYPRIVLYEGGEVLVPDLEVNQGGEIVGVHGVTFIASDGNSIYLYFENGMPVRAIVDEHLIQFENFTDDTVDITFVSPDGAVTKEEKVPFDRNQIPTIGFQSSAHLASMVRLPDNKDIDWLPFIQGAANVFFCVAAATAVIVPTAGTATAIFVAGCATLAYSTYLAIANKETPISVEKTDIAISGVGCVEGAARKDPLAVKDCADAVIDIVEVLKKKTQETEQKLVTMVGADPNNKQELVIQAQIEPNSQSTSNCTSLNLTPEEKVNCGVHTYKPICVVPDTVVSDAFREYYSTTHEYSFVFSDDGVEYDKLQFSKSITNKYISLYLNNTITLVFTNSGFIHTVQDPDLHLPDNTWQCEWVVIN